MEGVQDDQARRKIIKRSLLDGGAFPNIDFCAVYFCGIYGKEPLTSEGPFNWTKGSL